MHISMTVYKDKLLIAHSVCSCDSPIPMQSMLLSGSGSGQALAGYLLR